MSDGFIYLWRKLLDDPIAKNPNLMLVWIHLLLSASHKNHTQLVGYQNVELKRGELVAGRSSLAISTGLSERTIRTCLNCLKSTGKIAIKATSKFSIITIINYDTYQNYEKQNDQQNDQQNVQQATNKRPTSDQQATTNNKGNKDNNGNKGNKRDALLPLSDCDAEASGGARPTKQITPYQEILALYRETLPDHPQVEFLDDALKAQIKERHREYCKTENIWPEFFDRVAESDFLCGRTERSSKKYGLHWLTKKQNFSKVVNNEYRNYKKQIPQTYSDMDALKEQAMRLFGGSDDAK